MDDFLQHFRSLHTPILAGRDSYDLGCLLLLSYIENIKRIGSLDRASFYRASSRAGPSSSESEQLVPSQCTYHHRY